MDKLLESFKQFEISDAAKNQIKGGVEAALNVTGCRQDGANSYIDYVDAGGTPHCDIKIKASDLSGWVDTCGGRLASV